MLLAWLSSVLTMHLVFTSFSFLIDAVAVRKLWGGTSVTTGPCPHWFGNSTSHSSFSSPLQASQIPELSRWLKW